MACFYLISWLILLKQAYSQCTSTSQMDIIFGIDASTYVSDANFIKLKTLVSSIITNNIPFVASTTNIGFLTYDSQTSSTSPTTYATRAAAAAVTSSLSRAGGVDGSRNTVQLIQDSKTIFDGLSNKHDKLLIILTSGNGVINDRTIKPVDVCASLSGLALRQSGVRVVTIGIEIGTTDQPAFKALHNCLGKDPYIISGYDTSDLSSISTTLQDNDLCPTTYQLKITEVKPAVTSTAKPAFAELYNFGKTVTLSNIELSGLFTYNSGSGTLAQGWYLVVYYGGDPPSSCTTANSCKAVLASASDGISPLTLVDKQSGTTQLDKFVLGKFPLKTGYSYELSYLQYDGLIDDNWEHSCTNTGTPGTATDLTCSTVVTCTTASCGSGGSCSTTCTCAADNYAPSNKAFYCKTLPGPIGACYGYKLKDPLTSEQSMRFIWTTNSGTEQTHTTTLLYPKKGGTTTTKDSGSSLSFANVLGSEYDFTSSSVGTVYYKMNGITTSSSSLQKTCTFVTSDPTPAPTKTPTTIPSMTPSAKPTPQPTPSSVWFYLSGTFCENDRCMCSDSYSNQLCCSDLESDLQVAKWGCKQPSNVITLQDDTQYPVALQKAETFTEEVCIKWTLTHDYMCSYFSFNNIDNTCTAPNQNMTKGVIIEQNTGTTCFNVSSNVEKIGVKISEDYNYTNYTGKYLPGFYQFYTLTVSDCVIQNPSYNITKYGGCFLAFPTSIRFATLYGTPPEGKVRAEKEFPKWLWWVLLLILLFLCCIALLLYKYCWKNRLNKKQIKDQEEELMDVERENELGWQHDLDPGNANFNPMNPNVNGFSNMAPTDHVSPNKGKYGKINDVVKVNAERFEQRQQFGQTANQGYKPPSGL